jgi:ABC-type proline/glycine betaine transport system ATPase subunit
MDQGEIVEIGKPDDLLHRPAKARTREFLGQITIDLNDDHEGV